MSPLCQHSVRGHLTHPLLCPVNLIGWFNLFSLLWIRGVTWLSGIEREMWADFCAIKKKSSIRSHAFHSLCIPAFNGSGASFPELPQACTFYVELSPGGPRCQLTLVCSGFLSHSLNSLMYAFLFLVVILMEFQEQTKINLFHKLPYLTRSHFLFSF